MGGLRGTVVKVSSQSARHSPPCAHLCVYTAFSMPFLIVTRQWPVAPEQLASC